MEAMVETEPLETQTVREMAALAKAVVMLAHQQA
jgi:hypothetical protein